MDTSKNSLDCTPVSKISEVNDDGDMAEVDLNYNPILILNFSFQILCRYLFRFCVFIFYKYANVLASIYFSVPDFVYLAQMDLLWMSFDVVKL